MFILRHCCHGNWNNMIIIDGYSDERSRSLTKLGQRSNFAWFSQFKIIIFSFVFFFWGSWVKFDFSICELHYKAGKIPYPGDWKTDYFIFYRDKNVSWWWVIPGVHCILIGYLLSTIIENSEGLNMWVFCNFQIFKL